MSQEDCRLMSPYGRVCDGQVSGAAVKKQAFGGQL